MATSALRSPMPRAWLPETAIDAGLDRTVATVARDWSARWLPGAPLRPLPRNLAATDADGGWLMAGDAVAVGMSAAARATLGAALLAAPSDAPPPTLADRRAVDRVVDAALGDLAARLAALAGRADAAIEPVRHRPPLDDPYQRLFGFDHAPLLVCLVGHAAAVALARPSGAAARQPALGALGDALAPQPVTLVGRVGGCTVTIAELAALEPGDVVLLDAGVDEPVALTLDGAARRLARCTLDSDGDALALTLLDSIDR